MLAHPPQALVPANSSWWTATRVTYLMGGFLVVALAGGAWLWTLRLRVRRAMGEEQEHFEEKAKLEKQLRQSAKFSTVQSGRRQARTVSQAWVKIAGRDLFIRLTHLAR